MILSREQKITLISVYYNTQDMETSKGGHAYVVFVTDDMPGIQQLVDEGYLLERMNPLYTEEVKILDEPVPEFKGGKMSYALTLKGRMAARQIPVTSEVKRYKQLGRKAKLKR